MMAVWKSNEATFLALLAAFRRECESCCARKYLDSERLCDRHQAALSDQKLLDHWLWMRSERDYYLTIDGRLST